MLPACSPHRCRGFPALVSGRFGGFSFSDTIYTEQRAHSAHRSPSAVSLDPRKLQAPHGPWGLAPCSRWVSTSWTRFPAAPGEDVRWLHLAPRRGWRLPPRAARVLGRAGPRHAVLPLCRPGAGTAVRGAGVQSSRTGRRHLPFPRGGGSPLAQCPALGPSPVRGWRLLTPCECSFPTLSGQGCFIF